MNKNSCPIGPNRWVQGSNPRRGGWRFRSGPFPLRLPHWARIYGQFKVRKSRCGLHLRRPVRVRPILSNSARRGALNEQGRKLASIRSLSSPFWPQLPSQWLTTVSPRISSGPFRASLRVGMPDSLTIAVRFAGFSTRKFCWNDPLAPKQRVPLRVRGTVLGERSGQGAAGLTGSAVKGRGFGCHAVRVTSILFWILGVLGNRGVPTPASGFRRQPDGAGHGSRNASTPRRKTSSQGFHDNNRYTIRRPVRTI